MRERGIPVTPREWLDLMEALSLGLAGSDRVHLYHLVRATCVKNEALYDTWDQVWLEVFADVETPSEIHEELLSWLEDPVLPRPLTPEELAWAEAMDLESLREAFEQRLAEQEERHRGGNHWIGTRGTSPFGHGGRHPGGLRVGGPGGGGMAAWVAGQRAFRGYRTDQVLDTRQVGVALKKLRHFAREGLRTEVDMEATIDATARDGGEIRVVERPERVSDLKVLLLMDTGGSMTPYARRVSRLFSAASRASHFRDLKAFYFHNCIYDEVYRDMTRWDAVPVPHLLRTLDSRYRLLLVGDACMAPTELLSRWGALAWEVRNARPGLAWLNDLEEHFERSAWLNPMQRSLWNHPTVIRIADLFPMFELTVDGLEAAMRSLGGARVDPPPIPDTPSPLRARRRRGWFSP